MKPKIKVPMVITKSQSFADEILVTIDAIGCSSDYKNLIRIITNRDAEIRNAAIRECFDTALNLNDGHEWPVSRAILALLEK